VKTVSEDFFMRAKTNATHAAAQSEDLESRPSDLVIGRMYVCGVHNFTIRDIAKYFGNLQVRFYDSFDQREKYEYIGTFRKMLQTQKVPE
jgi:hypothetical protein